MFSGIKIVKSALAAGICHGPSWGSLTALL